MSCNRVGAEWALLLAGHKSGGGCLIHVHGQNAMDSGLGYEDEDEDEDDEDWCSEEEDDDDEECWGPSTPGDGRAVKAMMRRCDGDDACSAFARADEMRSRRERGRCTVSHRHICVAGACLSDYDLGWESEGWLGSKQRRGLGGGGLGGHGHGTAGRRAAVGDGRALVKTRAGQTLLVNYLAEAARTHAATALC
eukprot:2108371-Rhodomonas_salina.3